MIFLATHLILDRYSILPALSLDSILHVEVLDYAINGANFLSFVEGLLDRMQPWPLPNLVLIMDNAVIHRVKGVREMVEVRGSRLVYLLAYSPDLNPIEEAFSSIKAWLCGNWDYVLGEIEGDSVDSYRVIWEVIHSVTLDNAFGWFQHSEYIAYCKYHL